jgi:hypothetical protein
LEDVFRIGAETGVFDFDNIEVSVGEDVASQRRLAGGCVITELEREPTCDSG